MPQAKPAGCGIDVCVLPVDGRLVTDAGLPFWRCPRCQSLRIPEEELVHPDVEPDAPGETPLVLRGLMGYRLMWLRATVPTMRSRHARVLDVGCGDGQWLEFLASSGYAGCVGMEVNPRRLAQARARGLTVHTSLADATQDGQFDVIFLWQVAEHVSEPVALIGNLMESLAPDGALVVSVPNQESAQNRLFGRRSSLIDYGRHVWYWGSRYFGDEFPRLVPAVRVRRLPEWNYEYEIYSWIDTLVSLCVGRHHFVHTRLKKGEGTLGGKLAASVLSAAMLPVAVVLSVATLSVNRLSSTQTYELRRAARPSIP